MIIDFALADRDIKKIYQYAAVTSKPMERQVKQINAYLDVSPSMYNNSKEVMNRLAKIKEFRSKSDRTATPKYAGYPSLFVEIRQPDTDYIIIPRHSSEN